MKDKFQRRATKLMKRTNKDKSKLVNKVIKKLRRFQMIKKIKMIKRRWRCGLYKSHQRRKKMR